MTCCDDTCTVIRVMIYTAMDKMFAYVLLLCLNRLQVYHSFSTTQNTSHALTTIYQRSSTANTLVWHFHLVVVRFCYFVAFLKSQAILCCQLEPASRLRPRVYNHLYLCKLVVSAQLPFDKCRCDCHCSGRQVGCSMEIMRARHL